MTVNSIYYNEHQLKNIIRTVPLNNGIDCIRTIRFFFLGGGVKWGGGDC